MILLINICISIVFYFFIDGADSASHDDGVDYHDTEAWKEKFPTCNGRRQSPIDLSLEELMKLPEGSPLMFYGYDNIPTRMELINTGHSLQLQCTWPADEIPYFSGGPLGDDDYVFEQLHFHWGPTNDVGSEHTFDSMKFPLEMHMVHYNKKYGSFGNAAKYDNGASVIGVFFDIESDGSTGIGCMLKEVHSVINVKSRVDIEPFALTEFEDVTSALRYASYPGSLTTPPCSEIVTWIFPLIVLNVTESQMECIRSIKLEHCDNHNYRPVQPRHGRTISMFNHY